MNADLQKKMKRKNEIESSQKRGPLLCFNKTPKFSSRITNISSSSSSSSSSSTVESSKSCLHFLPPSRSSSSSSASSKSAPQKKPKSIFRTKNANLNSNCSKENISPIPISQKPQKNAPSTNQWRSGKKPIPRTSQKPGLLADLASSGKKSRFGSQLISANKDDSKLRGNGSGKQPNQVFNMNNSSSGFQDRTPVGKSASGSGLDCANFDGNRIDESTHSSAGIVKTPPIEPSVSPEIPYGLSQKPATASAATPCYGAGHIFSGVTDKRKCRPRGVLTVAPVLDLSSRSGKSNESDNKSRTSFVPLPVEASMCWMSSPSDISGNGQFCGLMGSNPSITINPLKSHKGRVLRGCVYAELTPTCSNPSTVENNDSPHSTSTLSCGNVIQTPNSDCELGFQYELDDAIDVLRRASLSSSAQNQMPDSYDPGTSFKFSNCNSTTTFSFIGITECHKHGDTSASCLSESSTGNVSESNIRISWRDVSLSRIPAMDSRRWLPDDEEEDDEEKDNVFCSDDHQIKPAQSSEDSDDLVMEKVLKLPEFLEQEPCIYNNGMEKVFPQRPSSCAESILTDDCGRGGLVSSPDSDWNL